MKATKSCNLSYTKCDLSEYELPDKKIYGIQAKVIGFECRYLHSKYLTEEERDSKLKELRKKSK